MYPVSGKKQYPEEQDNEKRVGKGAEPFLDERPDKSDGYGRDREEQERGREVRDHRIVVTVEAESACSGALILGWGEYAGRKQ